MQYTNGVFTNGSVDVGTGVPSGLYIITLRTKGFLRGKAGILGSSGTAAATQVNAGTNNQIGPFTLLPGDITSGNGQTDNVVDASDYGSGIQPCYGSKFVTSSCPLKPDPGSTGWSGADLNDDGQVDGVDYNLFIRSLAAHIGE